MVAFPCLTTFFWGSLMSRCYIFHDDQVNGFPYWPADPHVPLGCYSFEPQEFPDQRWGHVTANTRDDSKKGERDFYFIDALDVPTTVPTLYLNMALLLT